MAKTVIPIGSANDAKQARSLTGSPVAADSSTIDDTHFDPTAAISPAGFKSVMLYVRLTGGSSPNAQLQILHRVPAVSGNGWAVGMTSVTLTDGQAMWVETMGRDIFPRVAAVSGNPTGVDIYVAGWESYRYDGPRA